MAIDPTTAERLARFSAAFNSDDRETTRACVTDDFRWVYYEGSQSPDARIFTGVDAACQAVVDRATSLDVPIRFSGSEHHEVDDKVFVRYRATGSFKNGGPFDVRAIDVYTFRGELLAEKDTYWKIVRD